MANLTISGTVPSNVTVGGNSASQVTLNGTVVWSYTPPAPTPPTLWSTGSGGSNVYLDSWGTIHNFTSQSGPNSSSYATFAFIEFKMNGLTSASNGVILGTVIQNPTWQEKTALFTYNYSTEPSPVIPVITGVVSTSPTYVGLAGSGAFTYGAATFSSFHVMTGTYSNYYDYMSIPAGVTLPERAMNHDSRTVTEGTVIVSTVSQVPTSAGIFYLGSMSMAGTNYKQLYYGVVNIASATLTPTFYSTHQYQIIFVP
jgi:hypothetical protein